MANSNFYLVFPKISSYAFKSDNEQEYIRRFARCWYEKIKESGYRVCCFAEDRLAVELLSEKQDISWFSTIMDSDKYFLNKYVRDIPPYYHIIKTLPADEILIRTARHRFKGDNRLGLNYNNPEVQKARLDTIAQRIRYVSEEVLKEAKFIVYLRANNNYCKIPEPYLGDGKLIIENDITRSVETIVYGGTLINEGVLSLIMKGV